MPVLRLITDAEFLAWKEAAIADYAEDKVRSGQWSAASAVELSRQSFDELLPQGVDTPDHYLYTILNGEGTPVGTLWFAAAERGGKRVAHVYDVIVDAAHRRQGHAQRAFKAMEKEVLRLGLEGISLHVFGYNEAAHALYVKLGYVPTNIHMFKPVGQSDSE